MFTVKIHVKLFMTALLLTVAALVQAGPNKDLNLLIESERDAVAEEAWAYSLGVQAYVFGLPLVVFEREYALRTNKEKIDRIKHKCPCAMMNQIGHKFDLASADDVMPYTPNNDTVYSGILLDFSEEPMILSMPDIADRYWSVEVADPYTENKFYIGTRATKGKGGHHAFVSKDWRGELPSNVIEHRMDYSAAMVAVRIAVKPQDERDLKKVHKLQKQAAVTSLSNFKSGKNFGVAAMPANSKNRPHHEGEFTFFQLLADLLAMYPPAPQHFSAVNNFKLIGLVPGQPFEPKALSEPTKKGLIRAIADSRNIMKWKVKYRGTPYATRWNNLHPGTYGSDYFDRAAGALEGLFVHDREEAVYFSTYESGDTQFLDGSNQYRLHFDKDELPQVNKNGFWSLTMYGSNFQLVKNDIGRFSIGDRTDGLKYNKDGSLDIYVQSTPPEGKESNWLPSPVSGLFRVNYRIYLPQEVSRNPETLSQYLPPLMVSE